MRTDHLRHFGDLFEITRFHLLEVEEEGANLWEIMNVDHLLQTYDMELFSGNRA